MEEGRGGGRQWRRKAVEEGSGGRMHLLASILKQLHLDTSVSSPVSFLNHLRNHSFSLCPHYLALQSFFLSLLTLTFLTLSLCPPFLILSFSLCSHTLSPRSFIVSLSPHAFSPSAHSFSLCSISSLFAQFCCPFAQSFAFFPTHFWILSTNIAPSAHQHSTISPPT